MHVLFTCLESAVNNNLYFLSVYYFLVSIILKPKTCSFLLSTSDRNAPITRQQQKNWILDTVNLNLRQSETCVRCEYLNDFKIILKLI